MTLTIMPLIDAAPVHFNQTTPDPAGVEEAFQIAGIDPETVVAVSHCQFGTANIEALVDEDTLAFAHPGGVLCTAGKRKMIGKKVKYKTLDLPRCRGYAPVDYASDSRPSGKFGIEFGGPGSMLLGRVQWTCRASRFRDSSEAVMAVAEERDRILGTINGFGS